MSTSDSVAIRTWPMACVPVNAPSEYCSPTASASPRSLTISSELPIDSTSALGTSSMKSTSVFRSPVYLTTVRNAYSVSASTDSISPPARLMRDSTSLRCLSSRAWNSKSRGSLASASL